MDDPLAADTASGGRERLLAAATRLFGERGYAGTTVRAVATAAKVSAPLVLHHFGSKAGLREAVDADVLGKVRQALAGRLSIPTAALGAEDAHEALVARLVSTVGAVVAAPGIRDYLRRSILESDETGGELTRSALAISRAELDALIEAGAVRQDVDRDYAAVQLLMLTLGPLLLSPILEEQLAEPVFSAEGIARRVRANIDLLVHGLLEG